MSEKLYVFKDKINNVIWFVRKSGKWLGKSYYIYEDYAITADDMIAISKLNGIEYDKVDIEDPFTIVGSEPIYDFKTDQIIFQSDHKHTPLYDYGYKSGKYVIRMVNDISQCFNPKLGDLYMELPLMPVNGLCDAYIPLENGEFYKVSLNVDTGELTEKK